MCHCAHSVLKKALKSLCLFLSRLNESLLMSSTSPPLLQVFPPEKSLAVCRTIKDHWYQEENYLCLRNTLIEHTRDMQVNLYAF